MSVKLIKRTDERRHTVDWVPPCLPCQTQTMSKASRHGTLLHNVISRGPEVEFQPTTESVPHFGATEPRTHRNRTEDLDDDDDDNNMRRTRINFRGHCPRLMTLLLLLSMAAILSCSPAAFVASSNIIDPGATLECHLREYSYKVYRADSLGRKCWDHITVMSCWGRCDSNEVADWQFPYKLPFHPVCIHDQRVLRTTELTNCEPEVEPGTDIYEYYEAVTCACQICQSSFANCEGLHYRSENLT